jgi:hypothetical protein
MGKERLGKLEIGSEINEGRKMGKERMVRYANAKGKDGRIGKW